MCFCFKYYWFTVFFYFLFPSSFSISFKEIFNCDFKIFVFHNIKFNCSGWCNRNTGVWLMRPNWIPILPACEALPRIQRGIFWVQNRYVKQLHYRALRCYLLFLQTIRRCVRLSLIKQLGRQLIYLSIIQSQGCL